MSAYNQEFNKDNTILRYIIVALLAELKDKVYDYHSDTLKPKDYQDFMEELLYDCESYEEGLKRKSIIKFCKNLMLAARKYQRPFDPSKDYIINPNNI